MGEQIVSSKLPVLALRGLAVFPKQTVHFDVGRTKSAKALERAMKNDQIIFLIPQKNIADDDPVLDDFFPIGAIVKVKQILKSQGETIRVLVTGLCRGRISHLYQQDPYL